MPPNARGKYFLCVTAAPPDQHSAAPELSTLRARLDTTLHGTDVAMATMQLQSRLSGATFQRSVVRVTPNPIVTGHWRCWRSEWQLYCRHASRPSLSLLLGPVPCPFVPLLRQQVSPSSTPRVASLDNASRAIDQLLTLPCCAFRIRSMRHIQEATSAARYAACCRCPDPRRC